MLRSTLLMLALAAVTAAARAANAAEPDGVVVDRVTAGLAADKAGLKPGDRLLRWAQGAERGTLATPLSLTSVEIERGPRGAVAVEGVRDGAPFAVSLFPDEWGIESRPAPGGGTAPETIAWAALERALAQLATSPDDARRSVADAVATAPPHVAALVHFTYAEALRRLSQFGDAARAYDEAIRREESVAPNGVGLARMIEGGGFAAYGLLADLPRARARLEIALRILDKDAPSSLAHARTLHAYAQALDSTADARPLLARAAAIAEELAPDSLTHASVLYALAWVTPTAEQLALAQRALAIRERLAPESLATAASLRLVGLSLDTLGRGEEGRASMLRAAALLERVEPVGSTFAGVLESLGGMAQDRGELAAADAYLRRAVDVRRSLASPSRTAITLANLVDLLVVRREFDEAEGYAREARGILESSMPESEYLAYCLRSLGDIAFGRGDAAGAEAAYRRAAEIFRKVNPTGFALATTQNRLGRALTLAGRLDEAQAAYGDALALAGDVDNIRATDTQDDLGALALQRGDLDAAQAWFEKALNGRRRLAPDSVWEALSEHALGVVARRRGRREDALAHFRRAVDALDAQSRRLGGSAETAAAFRAHFEELHRDLEELLLESGRPQEAFAVVESARARGLLSLLAQRDLAFPEVPGGLERERRQADADHDDAVDALARAGAGARPRADLVRAFEDARHRQEDVRARIRAAAPRLAALRDPEPLDLPGVRRVLEPGTLLLVYSLGPSSSRVYAVGPGPEDFAVHDLGAPEPALRAVVDALRARIDLRRTPSLRQALDREARTLGTQLLGPVAKPLAAAARVLVVPDGVLHLLPFAALQRPVGGGRFATLVEAAPVHVASSVTLYATLARGRRADAGGAVVGFGDPAYGAAGGVTPDAAATRALKVGLRLAPLPATRGELQALEQLAPGSARVWLGADATETRAKAVGRDARILHFATHGFVDEDFPLESGLALASPARGAHDNGLLQAWEIFESMRLDADLVTLSACQTALGKQVAGEGLVGLTWAFQYAGARSVLASLWEVNDASTAELMGRFYGYLRSGAPKAEALRRAQVDLMRRPDTSAPFFWAGFELIGDWR